MDSEYADERLRLPWLRRGTERDGSVVGTGSFRKVGGLRDLDIRHLPCAKVLPSATTSFVWTVQGAPGVDFGRPPGITVTLAVRTEWRIGVGSSGDKASRTP